MIVQRTKRRYEVGGSTIEAQVSKLFREIVLFCDPLFLNVTSSSICVSLCLVLSEPDHISALIFYKTISLVFG